MTLDKKIDYQDTIPQRDLFCPLCQRPSPTFTKPYPSYRNTLKIHCFNCGTFIGTAWKEAPHGETTGPNRLSTCCDGV